MLSTPLVERILDTVPHKSVGLLGDLFLDRYLDIDPRLDEPSVETGETAYQVACVRGYPGALGTVLNNLAALGVGTIRPVTLIGDDGEGYELRQLLNAIPAVKSDGVLLAPVRRTPTYTKPMYGTEELNRLDIKNRTPTPADYGFQIYQKLREFWFEVDAWIVLDQVSEEDCGVVTTQIRECVNELAIRDSSKFVMADSRERIASFRNVCVKPNARECGSTAGIELMQQRCGRTVFGTDGENGIFLADGRSPTRRVPAYPVAGPIDVCGAGDSCSAGITCAMMAGATPEEAAAFGNLVASITIQQIGVTGTATPGQVRARWSQVNDQFPMTH
jgi:bifunctional ADP-heptose synthase (sugar kinase/adenylyltransferase)